MPIRRSTHATSEWYRTDNAGRIFASLYRWQITSVFRLSASLDEPVSLARLQTSVERVMGRFPYFNVHLRQGMFWCFFEPSDGVPEVQRDSRYPCNRLSYRHGEGVPFRIRVYHRRIALEMAHVLTDGTGAITLLRSILADYLGAGDETELPADIFSAGQLPHEEELEDAFRRYHRPGLPPMSRMERAFQIEGTREPRGVRHITTGILETKAVIKLAKERGCTLGEFLIASYLCALQDVQSAYTDRGGKRPIRLDVPVNLRTHLPSKTMRNFFLPTYPEIDPRLGSYEFDEVAQTVHHFMKGVLQEKYFLQMIGRNVGAEQNPLLRAVPLFLKNLILPEIYTRWNLTQATSGFSNLGRVTLPECIADRVERFDFVPTHPSTRGVSCGLVSYGDRLNICFNRILKEPTVERHFFRTLSHMGLKIKVESNE